MFTPHDDQRVRNTLLITGTDVRAGYDKIHLFDAFGYSEVDTVAAGEHPVIVDVAGVRLGVATCYDIRFPEQFTAMADAGADVVVVSASWGRGPGKVEQWSLLSRARALDSTTFVVACGQADPEASGEIISGTAPLGVGHSVICAPDGRVVGELGAAPELLTFELDVSDVDRVRRVLPVLANRRLAVGVG